MKRWDSKKIKTTIDRALCFSRADAAVVRVLQFEEGATRYANSEITQNLVRSDVVVEIEVAFDSRVGRSWTNCPDSEAIESCVRRAEAIARVSPPDPEYMPPVEPMAHTEATRESSQKKAKPTLRTVCQLPSPAERAEAIRRAVALAERENMTGAGVFASRIFSTAIGNSAGLFVHEEEAETVLTFSATSPDSVGWAYARTRDVRSLDVKAVARRAIEKARAGRTPHDIAPGRYDVILEPPAVAELLAFFFFYQMDAKATDEGRTFLSGKKGTRIAAPNVTLFSDPTWPPCLSRRFTHEGMTLRRVDWIREGVLESPIYSRFWAKKQGTTATGFPSNLIMEGGNASVEEMVHSTRRGLLVTRFWYVRAVEPMCDLYTGMTRDGTFLIEGGRIVGPVKNLRFNESVVRLLANVELLGQQQIADAEVWVLVPYLKARDFNFTSATRF